MWIRIVDNPLKASGLAENEDKRGLITMMLTPRGQNKPEYNMNTEFQSF